MENNSGLRNKAYGMMKNSDGISVELSVQIIVIPQNEGNTSSQKL